MNGCRKKKWHKEKAEMRKAEEEKERRKRQQNAYKKQESGYDLGKVMKSCQPRVAKSPKKSKWSRSSKSETFRSIKIRKMPLVAFCDQTDFKFSCSESEISSCTASTSNRPPNHSLWDK